jgi:ribosomal protein L12E/L44/L45/RPP1/RPP2
VRVIQHTGAGFISKKTARGQLDYVDDPTSEQNWIDQEQLSQVLFQRFSADPNTPLSAVAEALVEMGKGKDLTEVMEEQAAKMLEREKAAQEAATKEQLPAGAAPRDAGEEALALDKGETPEGAAIAPISPFAPPPLQQQIVTSRRQ